MTRGGTLAAMVRGTIGLAVVAGFWTLVATRTTLPAWLIGILPASASGGIVAYRQNPMTWRKWAPAVALAFVSAGVGEVSLFASRVAMAPPNQQAIPAMFGPNLQAGPPPEPVRVDLSRRDWFRIYLAALPARWSPAALTVATSLFAAVFAARIAASRNRD